MTIDVAQLTIKPGVESGFFVERILLYLGEFVFSLEGGLRRVALLHYFLSPPSFPPQGETCIANSPYRQCYTTFRFVLFFCLDTKEPKSQGCTSVCLRTTLHFTACTPTRKRHSRILLRRIRWLGSNRGSATFHSTCSLRDECKAGDF